MICLSRLVSFLFLVLLPLGSRQHLRPLGQLGQLWQCTYIHMHKV
jgi:hypothetical protein